MKFSSRQCFFVLVSCVLGILLTAGGDELIDPTRKLQDPDKMYGFLSVYSEPPGLEAYLNDNRIGTTPIFSMEVEPGTHVLQINDSKKQIRTPPGEFVALTFHNDTFIQSRTTRDDEPVVSDKEPAPGRLKEREPIPDRKQREEKVDPQYWPFNPRGPIK